MQRRCVWLLLVGVMGSGCMQKSQLVSRGVIGQGLGQSRVSLEGSIEDFEKEVGLITVGAQDWEAVKLGVWRWSGDQQDLAEMVGGFVDGENVVLAQRRDGSYLLEIYYGVGSISTGDSRILAFDVGGLVASGIVENGDEFVWSQTTEERLPITSVVAESGATAQTGFEVITSGTVLSGAVYGDVEWCVLGLKLDRTASTFGGLRVDGVQVPMRCGIKTGQLVPVYSYSDARLAGPGLPIGGAQVHIIAVRVSWLGTGTPSWLR